ncbi:hypothetical protein GN157_05110 [Flavobacterium rakeshii]|uniref:Uncharacterized protein n=1 Tax=Flavobacterium rakeshii TaxID=1038845 RepID=A0A6N8HAW0_9FLAO|nr:hypothetical protein [Flavobacterium rakeshii]MUV03083.1 hypothetical protein [Flavobacterium rakeshii]
MKNFISKLNWRLILVHVLATYFFVFGIKLLSFFSDIEAVKVLLTNREEPVGDDYVFRIGMINLYNFYSGCAAIILVFIISLILCKKYRWYWGNSLIVFIFSMTMYWLGYTGWTYVKIVLLMPGTIFKQIEPEFITNILILLTFGVLFLFNKRIIRFVETGRFTNCQVTEPVS